MLADMDLNTKKEGKYMALHVEAREVDGVLGWYPACQNAEIFAEMVGARMLTEIVLMHAAALGYEVVLSNGR